MHQFEHKNSDIEVVDKSCNIIPCSIIINKKKCTLGCLFLLLPQNKLEYLVAYDQHRQRRLLNCTHNYDYEIMNFTALKSHIKEYPRNQALPPLPYTIKT